MKKILISVLILILFVVIALALARNFIVKAAIIKGVEVAAGVEVKIGGVDIGLFKPYARISSLKVYNPDQFTDRLMADIPQIYLDYDFGGILKNKVHLKKLKIEIKELAVVMNERGKLNINSLAFLLPKPGGAKSPEVKIDVLALKIDKVVSRVYLPALKAKTAELNLNLDEAFHDVTNPSKVGGEILKKILSRTNISGLASLDVSGQADKIKQQAQEIVDKAIGEDLKNILSK